MKLYRLSLNTILCKKTLFIYVVLLLVLPLLLPLLTPWEEKPSLLEPARAQTAWSLLWFCGLVWLLLEGANLGNQHFNNGILQYFKTIGVGRIRQLLAITASCLSGFSLLIMIALCVSLFGAMPGDSYEAKHWVILNFQYTFLFALVMIPLLFLAVSLGTRINNVVAYLIPCGIGLYGLVGVTYIDFFLADSNNPLLDFIYAVSPHFHLADLTNRLVFKMGSLSAETFGKLGLYLAGIALIFTAIAICTFRETK